MVKAEISIDNGVLIVKPTNDFSGDIDIFITVSDGEFETNQKFILSVIPINDSPEIFSISNYSVLEDNSINIEFLANDIDSENLFYSVEKLVLK